MELSNVLFKVKASTLLGQHVRVVGDHPHLGSWNPERALVLSTREDIYPYWISNEIISIGRGNSPIFGF